jgi:hypothetical protein
MATPKAFDVEMLLRPGSNPKNSCDTGFQNTFTTLAYKELISTGDRHLILHGEPPSEVYISIGEFNGRIGI